MNTSQLLQELSDEGIRLWEKDGKLQFRAPKGAINENIKKEISKRKNEIISLLKSSDHDHKHNRLSAEPDLENRYTPFPLSDVQSAYLIGRNEAFELGNIACHSYYELEQSKLDIERLNSALNKLIQKHETLKLIFMEDGTQKILEKVPQYKLKVSDLRDLDEENAIRQHDNIRETLSHKIHDAGQWPLFEVGAILFKDCVRLYLSLDLLVADFFSAFILFRDLVRYYDDPEAECQPVEFSFRDYVLKEHELTESKQFLTSRDYWMNRIDSFPLGPQLPFAKEPGTIKKVQFVRREFVLDEALWSELKKKSANYELTPSVVLMTVYSEILSRWSKTNHFAMNLTLFNRLPVHPDVMNIAGDFTCVNLLEVNTGREDCFKEKAKIIQNRLWEDLDNRHFSGIKFIRELTRLHNAEGKALMPVVFSSTIGVGNKTLTDFEVKRLGSLKYGITQTPQVFLDHQVIEHEERLFYNWDAVESIFPENLLDDMFDAYTNVIVTLSKDETAWNGPIDDLISVKSPISWIDVEEDKDISQEMLHTLFEKQVHIHPEKNAVVTTNRKLSYEELNVIANKIGEKLQKSGALPGALVGVVMERGWEQVAGALGVLKSGAAYLPIDPKVPVERLNHLLVDSGVRIILTQSKIRNNFPWPEHLKIYEVDKINGDGFHRKLLDTVQSPDDLAYVIYTSGSTGLPKGVMIDHKSAVNTIFDVNDRFAVTPDDKVFSLAAMNFDLSVYDFFGTLAAGATIVIPDHEYANDPGHWLNWINTEGITVWNSVPQLMQMLTDYLADREDDVSDSLRLVMMSGDWIPLDLPKKIRSIFCKADIYSLGGATEASIWSICYPIKEINPCWKSIPYGRSMKNQNVYVLNKNLEFCPVWVTGDLYIEGRGLAKGYLNDKEKTNASFIIHPKTNQRLYKTGDLGRYLPDNNIEFCGRDDFQVKVNGYRVELGEIESAINTHPNIKETVVSFTGEAGKEKHLTAYVVLNGDEDSSLLKVVEPSIADFEIILKKRAIPDTQNGLDNKEYILFYKYLEEISIEYICYAFNSVGIFTNPDDEKCLPEIMERGNIDKRFEHLISKWLETLCDNDLLTLTDKSTYIKTRKFLKNNKTKSLFQEIKQYPVLLKTVGEVKAYLERIRKYFKKIIQGETEVLELFFDTDNLISPERFSRMMPGIELIDKTVGDILKKLCDKGTSLRPLKILEIGARTGETTAALIPYLSEDKVVYTASDASLFFTDKIEERFNKISFVNTSMFEIENVLSQVGQDNTFDIVIAPNSLHRAADVRNALKNIQKILSPDGVVILTESTINSSVQNITVGFIEEGFNRFEDQRAESGLPLFSAEQWVEILASEGFEDSFSIFSQMSEIFGQDIIIAKAPSLKRHFEPGQLNSFLKNKLPHYMLPSFYMQLPSIPLTSNGKLDRNALPNHYRETIISENEFKTPENKTEILLAKIWGGILKTDQISVNSNFFNIGGDSLVGTRIIAKVREELGIEISLRMLFEFPTIRELSEQLENFSKESEYSNKALSGLPQIRPDRDNVYKPFPITDVQHAYLIGRSGLYALGKVGAHCYYEFEGVDLNIGKLTRALNRVICHHDMMRSVFLHDDMQQVILKEVPEYKIEIYDFNHMPPKEADIELLKIRGKMSHQIISTDKWPLFDIRASLHNINYFRLHIGFDNSVFDGWSMFYLINEMSRLYKNPEESLLKLDLSFRDYVLEMEKIKDSNLFKKDRDYWLSRLGDLPPSPDLPMVKKPEVGVHYHFTRFEYKLDSNTWEKLKSMAKAIGVTPSGLLLSAYAEILNSRSANNEFTINLTTFNRIPIHKQVNELVGDFTSLTLLGVKNLHELTFKERAKNLQRQLWQDMDHPYFSGVQVLRELAKLEGGVEHAMMPIVFTSALGFSSSEQRAVGDNSIGRLNYSISQTPQVLIDHQVYETSEELVLIWDTVKELFPEGFIEDMFDSYIKLLETLAQNKEIWGKNTIIELNEKQKLKRVEINNTASELPDMTLHSMFEQSVIKRPLAEAVITSTKRLSYIDLSNYSEIIAQMLTVQGVVENTLIAIVMDKGWEQIAAVLGILKSGAAYLPISSDTPEERLKNILEDGSVKIVLTQSWLENEIKWPGSVELFFIDEIDSLNTLVSPPTKQHKNTHHPENLAYVIYTSGSTGQPKGVMIDHRGAVNTILDINKQFSINPEDKVLALAALNFDLSVYDIFGTLAAGGTIVIPEPKSINDPACWAELIKSERITIWNSVPQLMRMVTEYAEAEFDNEFAQSLRLVLLSGDWIPTDLPNRIKSVFNNTQVISLGGATEASIWSIFYPIEHIDSDWKSIPYGRPMSNQQFYVLNENMEHCPDWTTGHLYIGGIGLAKGYWNDQEKTKSVFVNHPETRERLYRTGDLGRYLPDGNIEFQGREDFQVKINGYRVETGEVESVLKQYPGLKNTVVHAANDQFGNKYLIGYLVLENSANFIENDLKEFLKQKLPAYMVPSFYEILDILPITPNGKIDRKQLPEPGKRSRAFTREYIAPHNKIEQTIANSFQEITGIEKVGIYDNFFDLGVDSMHLVKIQIRLKKDLNKPITIINLFEYPTITSLAEFLNSNKQNNSFMEYADKRAEQRNIRRSRRLKSVIQ
ncbi:non-ribosomal peptide synthetase [Desulfobacter curvatus]|uniref:non-ribosomal peptide synthetase n=1 Tax=Desulfobacter curvatus TaxID=2290 RepID=UPI0003652067|nr:non-ribosomal peptide synthetase [Desulfobacter curvatus]